MSATIRYNGSDGYVRDPDGPLVRYSDYQELQAKVEELESDLDILVNIVPQKYLDEAIKAKAEGGE